MSITHLQSITGHAGGIFDVISTRNKEFAYTSSADKYIVKWNLKTGKQEKFAIRLTHSCFRILLTQDENLMVVGNAKGGLHFIDLAKKVELRNIEQHKAAVFALTLNPHAKEVYVGDADGGFSVWDSSSMDYKLMLPFNCGKIRDIAIEPNGAHIALCCQDGQIRVLETQFFNEVVSFKAHNNGANCAVFKGDQLITGGKDAYISVWDWKNKSLITKIPAHNFAIYDLKLMDDRNKLVSASFDKTIKLWDVTDGIDLIERKEAKSGGHKHTVNRLEKLDELTFLSVSDDRHLMHWRLD